MALSSWMSFAAVVPVVAVDIVADLGVQRADVADDEIDAAAAVQRVDAVLAFQPVGVAATPDQIAAATAEDLIFARAAVDFVRSSVRVGEGVLGVRGPDR